MRNPICDTIFVMDPQFNVIGILSNNGAFPNAPFFDDTYIQELSTGAETYEFSTYSNAITSEILQLGNYIVFKYGNKYKLFQIMDNDDEHKESQIITCYCEMAGLELLTDYCEPFSIEGNVELFFNTVLRDTNWQLGGFSESLITKIQQVKIEKYTNVYKVIQENIETYGNIEIEFRVGFNGNTVTGFYIDVYENGYRGNKTYKRFEYGENVEGIKRNRNMYDFASAMIGTGKDGLTFKDIEWKIADGKPADKPKGQDFIVDLGANERFNKRGKYIKSLYESDDTNPQDLLLHSWERLQEVKEPKFDYEVDLALTDTEFEEISIGDTNYVIDNDYNPPILLECRVGKLEISLTDNSKNKCTLSNYKEVASKIREPKDGEDGKTPEIGDNGNWVIGGIDTGKPSQGLPGSDGMNGSDGVSPLGVTLAGQSLMKYLDKTTAPVPATIVLKCKAMKGATEVTEKCTYQWQAYYNSAWNNIGAGSTISIAYNSSYFLNLDILQIRVNVTYGTEAITLEHTISKVHDNKYISQQEIFDKLIENGNEFIYTDPGTGKIYINASYIKTGQFVADLIKGGILTLGGTGDNSLGDYGYMRVLNSAGTEEVAHLDGGEMWLDTLTCGNLIAENLDVGEINNSKIPTKLDADVTVYVDEAISDEQSSNIFEEGAVFNSFQGAMDAIPTNLNSHTATIKFRTDIHENIEIRGMNGGNVYILLCKKNIYGNVYIVANSAKILMYGGMESSDSSLPYPAIKPSELVNVASRMFSVCVATSPSVFFRYCNVYGKSDSSNKDLYYAIGAVDMGTVYIGNIKVIGSDNGVRASSLGRAYVNTTEGKVNNYAFRAVSGGDIRLNNTKQIGGGTNVSIAAGSTIVYSTTGVTFDSSSSTGSNDNTATVTKSVTLKSSLGDTYRSTVYNSWKKDNAVRQGDWGYGDCNGCWFFGSQFSELKGKTITKVVLKIKRNSGGYSASVSHVIKMHNHSSRPGGMPSYLSGWSKTVSIAIGETKTITITDSAVLNAIKGGTMKGFGLQSSYSKSNYSACSGVVSASVTYK